MRFCHANNMFRKPFHHVLKDRREALGRTQVQVAQLADVDRHRYPKIERGEVAPRTHEVTSLSQFFELDRDLFAVRGPNVEDRLLRTGANFRPRRKVFFPPQDRSNNARFKAARSRHGKLVQRVVSRLRRRPDFSDLEFLSEYIANGSGDESLFLLSLLLEGAQPCLLSPMVLGHLHHPIVDPRNRSYVGNRPFPAFLLDGRAYFFQVSVATPRVYTVDVLKWDGEWSVIEIDGLGHDDRYDRERTESIGWPVIRLQEVDVVNRCRQAIGWQPLSGNL